jgi:hypothetical protein
VFKKRIGYEGDLARWRAGVGDLPPAPRLQDAARVLCDPCRQWVNATIEHPARHIVEPILLGDGVVVAGADVATLAAWVSYHTMISSLIHPEAFPGFAQSDYAELRATARPPADHVIWIGCRESSVSQDSTEGVTPWEFSPRGVGVYSGILLLAIQYVVAAAPDRAWHEGEEDGFVARLWPLPDGVLEWPTAPLTKLNVQRMKQGVHPYSAASL